MPGDLRPLAIIMKKLFIFLVSLLIIIPAVSFAADKVIVFAASSTTNMIDEVLAVYNKKSLLSLQSSP